MVKTYQVEVNDDNVEFWRMNGEFHCEHGPAVRNLDMKNNNCDDERLEDVYYLHGIRFCSRHLWMDALRFDAVLKDLQAAYEAAETLSMTRDFELSELEAAHSDAAQAQVSAATASIEALCMLEAHKQGKG
tara:strand:+ start:675 stop:1067 length:393 start_codon:yes stop_codon:yes gene_type:complete